MEIRKIDDVHYTAKLSENDHEELISIMKDISLGKINEFELGSTNLLFDTILARRVGAEMLNRQISLISNGFAVVDVIFGEKVVHVSVGEIVTGDDKQYVTGVLYK